MRPSHVGAAARSAMLRLTSGETPRSSVSSNHYDMSKPRRKRPQSAPSQGKRRVREIVPSPRNVVKFEAASPVHVATESTDDGSDGPSMLTPQSRLGAGVFGTSGAVSPGPPPQPPASPSGKPPALELLPVEESLPSLSRNRSAGRGSLAAIPELQDSCSPSPATVAANWEFASLNTPGIEPGTLLEAQQRVAVDVRSLAHNQARMQEGLVQLAETQAAALAHLQQEVGRLVANAGTDPRFRTGGLGRPQFVPTRQLSSGARRVNRRKPQSASLRLRPSALPFEEERPCSSPGNIVSV
mmetsp:Transcript_94836/g.217079  ORF Transcript_94836/g.217079 Transcript_94836/m.217079 type:complete len:298 (+) Transcript_94836:1316-2209(+)